MLPDNELIAKVIAHNDSHAFALLVKRYQSNIRQFLRRLTAGDYAMADDLAQDCFMTAFEKLAQYNGSGSFSSWLHTLAYRRFLRVIQTGAQKYEIPCDVSWQKLTTKDSTDQDILAESLMSYLDVKERTVITLSCADGMSHNEIAQVTGIPLGTVKSHIAKAKQKLHDLMSKDSVEAS
ncbi:RNA polymerase sigma factor [Pleionea sediminis]|uniref:RNA polymerase sigma factor n=1 Tax=Pleionea sediminis TaxID=2569479 RepID=UPI001186D077|nr:sigma-70 family RNA polymerase sigma factor [Pleionea sediminis]